MIFRKTPKEIQIMKQGGKILAEVVKEVLKQAKPGVSELELDQLAENLIRRKGAEPGFKKVKGYEHTICACTNKVVVHGIPTHYKLRQGDVFGVDCGVYYKGFYTDMTRTILVGVEVGNKSFFAHDAEKINFLTSGVKSAGSHSKNLIALPRQQLDSLNIFLKTGERALDEAIKAARIGNRVGDISLAIQEIIEKGGYSVVRSLVGHGVGRELHEEPEIPGFIKEPLQKTARLKEGMTLAIEVIYNMGKFEVVRTKENPWTIFTKDGSLSATFEDTIAVTKNGPLILTR